MTTEIAVTGIRYGHPEDGFLEFAEGEVVKGIPEKELKILREQGAVVAKKEVVEASDSEAELKERVAELEAELAKVRAERASNTPTPGTAAEQLNAKTNVAAGNANPDDKAVAASVKTGVSPSANAK